MNVNFLRQVIFFTPGYELQRSGIFIEKSFYYFKIPWNRIKYIPAAFGLKNVSTLGIGFKNEAFEQRRLQVKLLRLQNYFQLLRNYMALV